MPLDLPTPDFDDAFTPDWLAGAGLDELPAPELPTFGDLAEKPSDPPAGWATAPPEPTLARTPPPRRTLAESPPAATRAEPTEHRRQFPTRVVQGPSDSQVVWQLSVEPTESWGDVRVRFAIPDGVPGARITHKPTVTRREVVWALGKVEAGSAIPLQIRFPSAGVSPATCSSPPPFEVSYTLRPVARLDARATTGERTRSGEPIELRLEVTNAGNGDAKNVRVSVSDRDRLVSRVNAGSIPAGAVVPLRVAVPPPDPGLARWFVRVEADGCDAANAVVEATVYAPLAVAVLLPERVELDAEQAVVVRVENPASVSHANVRVLLRLPVELQLGASDGQANRATAEVSWHIPHWGPHETREFAAQASGCLPGRYTVEAVVATSDETATATASGECVLVRGRHSIALADWLGEQAVPEEDDERTAPAEVRTGERHVLFRLGEQTYASPIRQLREVVRLPSVTPVPGTPDWLLGVANVRGDVLSVVDFPAALGLTAEPSAKRSLLVTTGAVGLTVDEVVGVRRCTPTPWAADDREESGPVGEFLTGLFELDRRLTPVLDLDRVLTSGLLSAGTA